VNQSEQSKSKNPIRSMTGFARVKKEVPCGEIILSLKSLNHRGLDVRFHLPLDAEAFENAMRTKLAKRVTRGHVDVRLSFNRAAGVDSIGLNRPLLEAYLASYKQAAEEYGLTAAPDLSAAFRIPGMLTEPMDQTLSPEFEKAVMEALDEGLDGLNSFREREGGQLADDIRGRMESIQAAAGRMTEIRGQALPLYQARLKERLEELLDGVSLEPQRLTQEAAVLADRSDVGEELARLKIHAGQLGEMLSQGGEIGKKIDFLLQEMQRETNTILSKTNGIGEAGLDITDLALATKADIEKIREQTLNLE
jgi:uncharacterized protein (TIGR00255 family)